MAHDRTSPRSKREEQVRGRPPRPPHGQRAARAARRARRRLRVDHAARLGMRSASTSQSRSACSSTATTRPRRQALARLMSGRGSSRRPGGTPCSAGRSAGSPELGSEDGAARPGDEAGLDEQRHDARSRRPGSPSKRSTASRFDARLGARARRARRAPAGATRRRARAAARASGRPARRRAPPRRRAARRSAPATRAARAPARFGHGSAAPYGCAGSAAASTSALGLVALARPQLAQPLDRAAERELRAAEALDEVAAPADAERLERPQLAVDRAVAAGDPLGAHAVARDDALPLEQELRERAPVAARSANSALGQRPASLRRGDRGRALRARSGAAAARACGDAVAARGAQRLPGVVRHLAGPDELPQRGQRRPPPRARSRRAGRARTRRCGRARRGSRSCASPSGGGAPPGRPSAAASSRK